MHGLQIICASVDSYNIGIRSVRDYQYKCACLPNTWCAVVVGAATKQASSPTCTTQPELGSGHVLASILTPCLEMPNTDGNSRRANESRLPLTRIISTLSSPCPVSYLECVDH